MKDLLIDLTNYGVGFDTVTDEEVERAIASVPKHESANLVVDLGNTCQFGNSQFGWSVTSGLSNLVAVASGTLIGTSIDMLHSDTFCNMAITGQSTSGQLRIQVQCSDSDTSGNYTDPTSGLAQFPTIFQSGGIVWINSGGAGGGIFGAQASGYSLASGFACSAAFQRPQRYVRANVLSETSQQYAGPLTVQFISQYKTTGSGGGFTLSPTSGTVSV